MQTHQRGVLGLVIAGLGLILLGGASVLLLSNRAASDPSQATDFSAVPAAVRFRAPALRLSDLAGSWHQLSDYAGQVVLVNLWATWCPPCQAEMPNLQKFFEAHKGEGFTVIAIEDGEPEADVKAFVEAYKLEFPIWLDPQHQATDHAFKTINLPSSYVIDRGGDVRLFWLGAINGANLERYVTPIIREN